MANIAYIDVDTQFDFMNPKGNLYVQGAKDIVPNLEKLIKNAQTKWIPIVGSVDAHIVNDPEFQRFPPHCVVGTAGQKKIPQTTLPNQRIIPLSHKVNGNDLMPPGPVILEKNAHSLFDNPNAEAALRATGAKHFMVFGVALDICVRFAAEGLLDRGYEIDLIEDATASVSEEAGRKTIKELKKRGARIITTKQALKVTK
jgi:nicotinamidase/pyrazinamidase